MITSIFRRAKQEIKLDEDLIILSIMAGIIASFGIYFNNLPLLIGAMLISPYLEPVISIAVFISDRKFKELGSAVVTFLFMIIVTIVSSSIVFFLLTIFFKTTLLEFSLFVGMEYFIIAVVLGMVSAFLWTWPQRSNTSAGVSIAISLIPPIANIGRGIVMLSTSAIQESFVALILNITGLVIGAVIVFGWKKDSENHKG